MRFFVVQVLSSHFTLISSRSRATRSAAASSIMSLYSQLDCVYDCLNSYCGVDRFQGIVYERLYNAACILLRPSSSSYAASQHISNATNARKTPRTEEYVFVRPDQLFTDLSDDIPPFAYTHWSASRTFSASLVSGLTSGNSATLATVLQIRAMPSSDEVMLWFQILAAENANVVLGDDILATVINLAQLACAMLSVAEEGSSSSFDVNAIYLPDTRGVLHQCSSDIYIDDAPWLRGRLDTNKFVCIHSQVPSQLATILGVRTLSESVVEVVTPNSIELYGSSANHNVSSALEREVVTCVEKWNENLRSAAYVGALRKAIQASSNNNTSISSSGANMKSKSKKGKGAAAETVGGKLTTVVAATFSEEEVMHRLFTLLKCEIKLASRIQSRFLLYSTQCLQQHSLPVDITLSAEGSNVIFVNEADKTSTDFAFSESPRGVNTPTIYVLFQPYGSVASQQQTTTSWKRRWWVYFSFCSFDVS